MVRQTKEAIPRALRYAVWNRYVGKRFEAKCHVTWCETVITPFTFEVGHDVPESKGGTTTLENLRPICAQCNRSMGNSYTIEEFSEKFAPPPPESVPRPPPWWKLAFGCAGSRPHGAR